MIVFELVRAFLERDDVFDPGARFRTVRARGRGNQLAVDEQKTAILTARIKHIVSGQRSVQDAGVAAEEGALFGGKGIITVKHSANEVAANARRQGKGIAYRLERRHIARPPLACLEQQAATRRPHGTFTLLRGSAAVIDEVARLVLGGLKGDAAEVAGPLLHDTMRHQFAVRIDHDLLRRGGQGTVRKELGNHHLGLRIHPSRKLDRPPKRKALVMPFVALCLNLRLGEKDGADEN